MAYEMKDISVLTRKAAERFMKQIELNEKRRGYKKATPLILEAHQRVQNILHVHKLHVLQLSHSSIVLTKRYVSYLILVTSYF